MAEETAVDADVVVPVPDSGMFAAVGYSMASGLPLEFGLIRNHYVGRTFVAAWSPRIRAVLRAFEFIAQTGK